MASPSPPEEATVATASACRRENSAGRIPVVLTLAASDVAPGKGAPPPFYVMAPRLACLPSLVGPATRFYKDYLVPGEDAPWFDCGGVPLRSHVPVSTLHDLAAPPPLHPAPWPLTIHFRAFPSDALIRWPGPDPGRSCFFNALKEAACAGSGSAAGILSAPVPDRDAVWAAAVQGDAASAWTATSRMLEAGGSGGGDSKAVAAAACVPLRLFVVFGSRAAGKEAAAAAATTYTSRPVPAAGRTLGEALLDALPSPPGGGGAGAWSLVQADGGSASCRLALGGAPVAAVLTSSVAAPLAAPAAWAHAALAAPDRFLYVVVRVV